jgi:capsular polysaccharide biosynthesis protein
MSSSSLTEIEEKKKENERKEKTNSGNNWTQFSISILSNIFITLVIGVLGSNFIYMTTASTKTYTLDNLRISILDILMLIFITHF